MTMPAAREAARPCYTGGVAGILLAIVVDLAVAFAAVVVAAAVIAARAVAAMVAAGRSAAARSTAALVRPGDLARHDAQSRREQQNEQLALVNHWETQCRSSRQHSR